MISFSEKGVLKVDNLALHMNRTDLTAAADDQLRSHSVSTEEHAGMRGTFIFPDNVMAALKHLQGVRQREQGCAVIGAQAAMVSQPVYHRLQRWWRQ
jgi:hypothetical protein